MRRQLRLKERQVCHLGKRSIRVQRNRSVAFVRVVERRVGARSCRNRYGEEVGMHHGGLVMVMVFIVARAGMHVLKRRHNERL